MSICKVDRNLTRLLRVNGRGQASSSLVPFPDLHIQDSSIAEVGDIVGTPSNR